MPNTRLTMWLARRTTLTAVGRLQRSPLYETYAPMLAWLVYRCGIPSSAARRSILAQLRTDARGNARALHFLEPLFEESPPAWNGEAVAQAIVSVLGGTSGAFNLMPDPETFDREARALLSNGAGDGTLDFQDGLTGMRLLAVAAMWQRLEESARRHALPLPSAAGAGMQAYALADPLFTVGDGLSDILGFLNPARARPPSQACQQLQALSQRLSPAVPFFPESGAAAPAPAPGGNH
jgi:hypothetical protein